MSIRECAFSPPANPTQIDKYPVRLDIFFQETEIFHAEALENLRQVECVAIGETAVYNIFNT